MISGDMTVARLLDEHPVLLDVLVDYHPHFKQLRHRLLRRLMAPRVTVRQAARIAGVPEAELIGALCRAVGGAISVDERVERTQEQSESTAKPAFLAALPQSRHVHLDAREDIRQGKEPFARIMAAVKGLHEDAVLVLRAPFEPFPLYDVLGTRGFAHWTERHAAADWSVWFYRDASAPGPVQVRGERSMPTGWSESIKVDVRGLEPPQPMMRVLERLDALRPGERLEVLHDRRPLFLYPQLEAQGFAHTTEHVAPGLVRITITRRS
jgi:uncharacterized protein (DUF2249 family)